MFLLDPFECPAVPVQGLYAVVYLDGHFMPIGGPRFTVAVDETNQRVVRQSGGRQVRNVVELSNIAMSDSTKVGSGC